MKLALLTVLITSSALAQTADTWTQVSPGNTPSQRNGHAMIFDPVHSQVVLFGGAAIVNGISQYLADTWTWDGSNWTQQFPPNSPSPRFEHSMFYDSVHGQVLLFGGFDGNSPLNDTWVWDGSNWTELSPSLFPPPPRNGAAIAYDPVHAEAVLFGGYGVGGFNVLSDTWLWYGAQWNRVYPHTVPPPRAYFSMVFDAARSQTVVFGGYDPFNATPTETILLNDTWVWDGSDWTQKSPQTSPPGRDFHAMAYDSVNNQTVMFGGSPTTPNFTLAVPLNDTWLWDGSNWTQQKPPTAPSARSGHSMAFDSAHNRTVMFGGDLPGAAPTTWLWLGGPTVVTPPPPPPPPPAPSVSQVLSASAFGGFSSAAPGSWVEIYGSNLAPDTRGWAGTDFDGNNAPTELDGVSVSIGEQAAFVDYISPTQVNVQLPSNVVTGGTQPITVTSAGVTSASYNINVNPTQPGLLATAQFKIGANQYVVAQLPDGNYVLPAGAITGVNSRPAKPGEIMVIYGVGFGAVTPDIAAGQIVTQSNQLSASLRILFEQTPAQLSYFGLAPNLVGLYQFDVIVPQVPDSDLVPLTFDLGGAEGTQTLFTAVHQ